MERDDPRYSGNRGAQRRSYRSHKQGWRETDNYDDAMRLEHEEPRRSPDARPARDGRGHTQRIPDDDYGVRRPASRSVRPDQSAGGRQRPSRRGDQMYSDGRGADKVSRHSERDRWADDGHGAGARTRPSTADSRHSRRGGTNYPSRWEDDSLREGGAPAPDGARGGRNDWDDWGDYPEQVDAGPGVEFEDRTLPARPFNDDGRLPSRGRRGITAALEPEQAERWVSRSRSGAPPKRARGIKALWLRYGTTGPRRAVIITLLVAIALCSLSTLTTGIVAASTGISAYSHATSGLAHLRAGEKALQSLSGSGFSVANVQQARSEFAAGQQDFAQVNDSLGGIPGVAESAPFAGDKLRMARNLSSVAANFAQIGVSACDALVIVIGALSNPFGKSGSGSSSTTGDTTKSGLTEADLATIQAKLTTINALLNDSTAQINALQPSDLSFDPKIDAQLMKLKAELPAIQQGLQEAQAFMGIAGTILGVGTPTNYLVELLDSTELRPGGGFIGNIGILTLSGGTLSSLHVQDVDLLDRPFEFAGGVIPFPPQYKWFPLVPNWSLRDSNLDADFPTDAMNAEKTYQLEGGKTQVQGVIAITPWLIEKALAITGPISVPEFKETVTPSNMVNLIHYYQLGPGHGSDYVPDPNSLSSMRKRFTAYLFKHFMERVKAILGAKRGAFIKLAMSAIATKDVQIYFNNPVAEQILKHHSLASTIDAPATGDSLLVVDANVIANKANNFITYTMADKVAIDQNGVATHKFSLTYKWPTSAASDANSYGTKTYYRDYVRVYVPPQATLISQSGWAYTGQSKAFGRLVFAGYLSLWYGGSQTISLSWKVPNAAVKAGSSWTYQELIQHQAGNVWSASMQIALPACGHVASVTAPWKAGSDATSATFKGSLTEDKSYVTSYTCAAS